MVNLRIGFLSLILTGMVVGCGEDAAQPPSSPWEAMNLPVNAEGDVTVPGDVRDYMQRRAWGYAHARWHQERLWDMQSDASKAQFLSQGYQPFDKIQEGANGSGLEFLAMHRHMFDEMREVFPAYSEMWKGWETIPREKTSPLSPVAARTELSVSAIAALDRLENDDTLKAIESEDALGLYIWTTRIVAADGTFTQNPDASAGIHDTTLHQRWAKAKSDVNLAEFSVTHENYIFWKMHGWIDDRWTRWRLLQGLPERDAAMDAAIEAQHMEMHASQALMSPEVAAEKHFAP
jgi:hypothetical protein